METDQIRKLIQKCLLEGDEEDWQKLAKELRRRENRALWREWKRLGTLKQEDLSVDKEKIWETVKGCQSVGNNRVWWHVHLLRYAAAILIPLTLGIWGWHEIKQDASRETVVSATLEPGQLKAILRLEDGQQIDLSAISRDTVLIHQGMAVRLDSARGLYYSKQQMEVRELSYNTIIVPRAGEYRLVLSDGTVVWLNADSELKYPVNFQPDQRRVFLRGEAYFEVAKNEKQPFIVEVGGMKVNVLGTKFNVNASRVDGCWQTTLVEGKVRVSDGADTDGVVLLPNQQSELKNGHFYVKEVDASVYTAWRDGKFYFESEPLEEIAAQLERWYDVQFFFTRENLRKDKFTGVIRKDYTADQILDIITKTTNVKFEIHGRTISVL